MNMSSSLNYTKIGDYQLPNLTFSQPTTPLGKYGRLRRTYLKEQRPVLYHTMLMNGSLYPHLMEVEQTAESRMQQTMEQLLKQDPAPDKAQNQLMWVQLGKTEDGFAINQYFVDHPEMVLGELTAESTQYGHDLTVAPIEGAVLSDQLAETVQHIEGWYTEIEVETPDIADEETAGKVLPADPDVKNFSYAVVDGEVYYRENSIMTQIELSDTAKARVTGMVELRQIVNQLIQEQLDDYPDSAVQETQARLNDAYDAFTKKYGLLNDRRNARLFEQDSSYYLLCSLENLDENKQLKSKADMFTKRTIRPERVITSVDTPSEALAVSMGEHGRVDLPYMAELLGTPGEYDRITTELSGVIFKDPSADPTDPEAGWQMADEYLSGDVRTKLRIAQLAAETNPEFAVNVDALTKAQPKELEASEIDVRLGATWIAPEIIQKFMQEVFQVPYYLRRDVCVRFSPYTAEWRVQGKSALGHGDIMSTETYGTHRANAYKILEDTLNLKDVRIYDTIEDAEGKPKRVLNKNETTLAQQKQQAIKDAFANWIWQDPQRRISLVKQYNELFNSTRPREYDGSHIHFVGMNPEITLREHQRNAIAHVLYGGNTLLAHEVGAGKTFEMAASAMEAKRLGLCQKSLFVVPNHLTEQWASEFLHLYPNAKLLVARKKDFETANRKKFCARIATGDYDAVIIGHSQFERIPLSFERQERIIQDQIAETLLAINELKANAGENFTIKQMERTRKTLEAKLDKLRADSRKDDVITFEQLGVDRLFVDESHFYKNLFLTTKMRNVAGLSTSEAQKSSDMFGKCRYLDEITGGRGVVFATGTPVSNSMTELYTVMRYLQYSTLQQKKLTHFDCWASTFGETTTAIELAPEGTGYRARTRFAKFFNLPELMSMFKEVADIKTSDQLHLPVPDAKFETVVVKPSETQKAMVQELSRRAAEIHSGNVDASVDNMLCVTNDGRKIGLDVRLMNSMLPDDPDSKLNVCVRNVLKIWEEGKDQKLTQLLFCDLSTPKNDGNFNVYDDIRKKLIAAGVPENEIEFIHNADTEAKKAALFSKVRSGDVRVLLGSTAKMGAGTNVQQRLVAVHHLDVGWKPSDMTQRNGRIIRQGNMNKEVNVFNYVTEGTFDSYLFQTLENKQRFISQIMTSKSPVRSCDDVDEQALSYAEIKALCVGNPLIKEKMDLDVQVAKLKVLKADHQSQKFRLEDKLLTKFPAEIQEQTAKIAALKSDAEIAAAHPQDKENFCGMVIKGMTYDEKKTAGERLILACMELPNTEEQVVGSYRGFELSLRFDTFHNEHQALLKGTLKYPVPLGSDPHGNIVRLDNALSNFADRSTAAENELDTLRQQQAAAQVEVAKPFPQEEELAQKSARLAELNAFIVATHTDREHIHNHIIYNSTALDSTRKFRDFLLSGLAVQRLSDLICLEHQLSVIEIKPYRERQKRTLYPPRESNRDKLCTVIDNILLNEKPADFEAFLQKLEQQGYEIKRGKHTSVKGARQKRFIRFRTLGAGYSEDEIKAVIAGEAEHRPHQKQPPKEKPFHLLVDIQAKLSEGKSESYARWAKRYNLKEMSKTLIFLQENKIGNIEEMQERVNAATARYHELGDSIKAAEQRMAEIAVLRAHIINYAKTRPVYDAYRKAGYSKKFLEEHREQITLHRAAKATFDEAGLKKLPKVKELNTEYSTLLSQKKAAYPAYRKARDEMQELMKAQKNVEIFFAEEKTTKEKAQTR